MKTATLKGAIERLAQSSPGAEIIAFKPYSKNPKDCYLAIVLVQIAAYNPPYDLKEQWVTWIFNAESGGMGEGNYFSRSPLSYENALDDFHKRGSYE